jgi:hypothetical protein
MTDFDHRLQSTAFTDGSMFATQPMKHPLQIWQNRNVIFKFWQGLQ